MELFGFVDRVGVVHLCDLAQEVDKLWVSQLVHALLVSDGIDDGHETLSEDHAQYLVRHIKLALPGKCHALLKVDGLLVVVGEVVESG